MKKIGNALFFSKASAAVFTALSALSVLFLYAALRGNIIPGSYLFNVGALIAFLLAVADAVSMLCLTALCMKTPELFYKKSYRAARLIGEIVSGILTVGVLVALAIHGEESAPVVMRHIKTFLPLFCTVSGFACLLLIVPLQKSKKLQRVFCGVMAILLAGAVYASLFPTAPYTFTTAPVVFDNGQEYSVVFATNDEGTAYIEYAYNGETVRLYDEDNGRKNGGSCIHTIKVPYAQLSGNTYKVGSTRVIEELSYGGRNGKTIESAPITFHDSFGDTVNVLTVSDWHTRNTLAVNTAARLGSYDAVVLLGDSAPALMYLEDVAAYLLQLGAALTDGTMPVLFARGNHETRGKEASKLSGYLGMDCFYYTTQLGNYRFVVLDSGEDKVDSHREYGDMVVYEQHRQKMVQWLEALENTDDSKTIALSHADDICIEEDLSAAAKASLDRLNVSLLVSGHLHTSEFKQTDAFPTLIDGGVNAVGKGTYVASMLELSPSGIRLTSVDNAGNFTVQEDVLWRS